MWCGSCKEAWNWREEEAKGGRAERVKCGACGGKDAVVGGEVKRNDKGEVKYFGCGEKGHKKWECPNMKKRKQEKAAPPQKVWEKVKEHSRARGLPPREAAMCMEGWTTPREVVTFVEYRGYNYKGTKTEENQGQGFLGKMQLCNMWCGSCKEA